MESLLRIIGTGVVVVAMFVTSAQAVLAEGAEPSDLSYEPSPDMPFIPDFVNSNDHRGPFSTIPEPSTLLLAAASLLSIQVMAVRRRRSQGVGWGEGTKYVPFGSDSRIGSCRLDGVHDGPSRYHFTGRHAAAVRSFTGGNHCTDDINRHDHSGGRVDHIEHIDDDGSVGDDCHCDT